MDKAREYQENKIVIFDWGGVIESHRAGEYNVHTAIVNTIKAFHTNLSNPEILERWENCNQNSDGVSISEMNHLKDIEEWFNRIKNTTNIDCSFEEFCKVYEKEFSKIHFYQEVVSYAHTLKDKCKIAILSNLGYLDKQRLHKQVHLNQFDYVWLSFEMECRKPSPKIYELVEDACHIRASNILLIDDTKENIEAAQKRKWHTCQAKGYELDKIKEMVSKFLENN